MSWIKFLLNGYIVTKLSFCLIFFELIDLLCPYNLFELVIFEFLLKCVQIIFKKI